MRTIDADALIAQMEADAEQMEEPIAKMFTYAAISDIKHAPTIEPQRKTGKWIKNSNGTYSCDKCHSWIPNEQHYYANFCLYCGAVMIGGEECTKKI